MVTFPKREVWGTIAVVALLTLAGCSGGADDPGAATASPAGTEAPTPTATPTEDGGENATATADGDGSAEDDESSDDWYRFGEGEAYGYAVDTGNGTIGMAWTVVETGNETDSAYQQLVVNTSVDRVGATTTEALQATVFHEAMGKDSVGRYFLPVRTPAVIVDGRDLSVGDSWRVEGDDVTVGDGVGVEWDRATAEVTGTAEVAGETCHEMRLELPDDRMGPRSCVKEDWPFALAVDTGAADYQLREFERP